MSNVGAASATPEPTPTADAGNSAESPEFRQAMQLLSLLFEPDDHIRFRPIETWTENGKRKSRTLWKHSDCRPLKTIWEGMFGHRNRLAASYRTNTFFGVAPRFGGDGFDYAWQIRTLRCLWADVDDVSPENAIARCLAKGLPRPSVVVGSGTLGGHLYWLLTAPYLIDDVGDPPRVRIEWAEIGGAKKPIHYFDDPATGTRVYLDDPATGRRLEHPELSEKAQRIRRILQGLAATIGGDHTIDATRLLRLPGTMNMKDARNGREPRPCLLLESSGERYDLSCFEQFEHVEIPGSKRRKGKHQHRSSRCRNDSKHSTTPTDEEVVRRISESKQGEKFQLLSSGQHDFRHPDGSRDDSRADESLCCILAYWTRDPTQIDRIFRTSQLCDEKWTSRADYRDMTINRALELVTDSYDWAKGKKSESNAAEPIKLSDRHSLVVASERATPSGKLIVSAKFIDTGDPPVTIILQISSAVSAQKEAARKLGKYLGDAAQGIDTEAVIDKVLTQAQERIDEKALAEAESEENIPTVREIVETVVPESFDLRYRLADGSAWSEKLGRAVKRQEFVAHTPGALMNQCANARDAGADQVSGNVDEVDLHRLIETSLKVLWASLMQTLPIHAADAGLSEETADAKQFNAALVRLWVTLTTHESTTTIDKSGNEERVASRASLSSRVRSQFEKWKNGQGVSVRGKWIEVQSGFWAWWRPVVLQGQKEPTVLLAMKFELFDQLKVTPPNVSDHESMTVTGQRYGVFFDQRPVTETGVAVTERASGGKRLAILSLRMTDEILSQPAQCDGDEEGEEPRDGSGDANGFGDKELPVTAQNFEEQPA